MKTETIVKHSSTWFLRLAVAVFGLLVLVLCIFTVPIISKGAVTELPRVAYMRYPFMIAMYGSAIAFYIALFNAFKLLNYIDKNTAFSELSVTALKHIKRCALVIMALFATTLPMFFELAQSDDAPGAILIGLAITGIPLVISVFAAILQKLLRNAITIKNENEFTV